MDSKTQNKRDWVKNIAIIFLVILLLLTFFSRTIMNASLPEVSAQYAQYATLSSAVKASGMVKANESYNVIFEEDEQIQQTRKVQSVYVKAGDTVEKDAPILALSNDPSEQLKQAREDLAEAKENYTKLSESETVDDLTSDKTLSDARRNIEKAEDKLKELEAEYNSLLTGGDPATVIKDSIKALNDQIKDLETQKKQAGKEIDEKKKQAEKDIDAQKKQAEKDIDAQIKTVDKRISDLNTQIAELSGKLSAAEALVETDVLSRESVYQKLTAAQNEYDGAQVTYENAKLAYDNLQAEADRWKEMVEAINASIGDVNKANELTNQIRSLEETLDGYDREAQRAYEDYQVTALGYERDRDEAIRAAEEACAKAIDGIDRADADAFEAYYNASSGGEDGEEAAPAVSYDPMEFERQRQEQREICARAVAAAWNTYYEQYDSLTRSYDRAVEDRQLLIDKTANDLADAQAKLYVIDMPEVDDVIHYEFGYDLGEAQTNQEKAQADADAAKEELTKAEAARDEAKTKVDNLTKQTQAEGIAAGYRAELDGLKAQLEASEESKTRYEESKMESNERFEEARTSSDERFEEARASSDERYDERIEAIRDKITEKNEELSGVPSKRDPDEVKKEIETQKDTIRDLKETFEITESTEGNTAAGRERELEKAKQAVEELEEKVKTYEGAENIKAVNAPIAGRIVSVNFVPGDSVSSGATVASIEIADKGYIVEITMSAEEARKVQVGAPVSVTNSWWYSNISASVAQVKSDPQSQGKNRIIVMEVSGDVSEGQTLNFSIGDRSQSYDSVLPNSAIREDNDGKFVLTVEAKKTPLGTRYTARRTTVEVIASDDTQSAVNGLYGSEFVITSSTTPITDGQQVRLAGD